MHHCIHKASERQPMTSSQSSNTTNGLNRRTLVKGAAWSTPAIAAAAAVPAYASSVDSEIPTV